MTHTNNAAVAIEGKPYAADTVNGHTVAKNIGEAFLLIMQEVGYVQKQGFNKAQNYKYAGEAQLIEALRPALIKHGVIVTPSGATEQVENIVLDGKKTYRTVVNYTFTYLHVASGTSLQVSAIGEGVDTGDKAAYKAATGALKYALRQPFLIETGDEPEAHDVVETAKPEYGPSAFGNASMRKRFCEDTIKSFTEAATIAELDVIIAHNKPTTDAMKSGSEHDVLGYQELVKQYLIAKTRIEQEEIAFRTSGIEQQLTPRQ